MEMMKIVPVTKIVDTLRKKREVAGDIATGSFVRAAVIFMRLHLLEHLPRSLNQHIVPC
jgi:hypothetical protein